MASDDEDLPDSLLDEAADPEQRLWELRQYETVIEEFPGPVVMTDSRGYVTFANHAFREQLGYDPAEDLHVSDFLVADDVDTILESLREVVRNDPETAQNHRLELTGVTSDGRSLIYEASVTLLPGTDFSGLALTLRNVTAQKRRDEVFEVMDRTLRHNLRNTVTVIMGASAVLEDEVSGDHEQLVHNLYESGSDLEDLGDRLRTLRGAIEESFERDETMHVERLVNSSVKTARGEAGTADISTHFSAQGELAAPIPTKHALVNIVENAIVHNDAETPRVEIWVTHAPQDGWIDIHVEDNGPGIPDVEREIVLGESSADQLHHTSGLGLWIARWVVEIFGGKLEIEDRSGTEDPGEADGEEATRGTVVTLRLPLADSSDA